MLRKLIAFQIFVYAIVFACAALGAVRWPSIMMLAGIFFADALPETLSTTDWRLMGLAHGAAWLLAALCYYASAQTLSGARKGAFVWFCFALVASVPCLLLHQWPPHWWQDVPAIEGAMVGGAVGAVLLFFAVSAYRDAAPETAPETEDEAAAEIQRLETELASAAALSPALVTAPEKPKRPKAKRPMRPGPAILRQRAHFARMGRNWPKPRRVRLRWA
jgi:hypothetical protein